MEWINKIYKEILIYWQNITAVQSVTTPKDLDLKNIPAVKASKLACKHNLILEIIFVSQIFWL
jgi:hypothetical protein